MLNDILEQKKCFKLICGAGNQDKEEVEKLVAVYAAAGANFFDICAEEDVIIAAQNGLKRVINKEDINNYYICASVGLEGDPHLKKAKIDQQKCKKCKKCIKNCPQFAIFKEKKEEKSKIEINFKRCIGCGKCYKVCKYGAIELSNNAKQIEQVDLSKYKIDCIELHSDASDKKSLKKSWKYLSENFNGLLSICINRSSISEDKYLKLLKKLLKIRDPYTTIIQTDGVSMSGFNNTTELAQKAIVAAKTVTEIDLPVFIIPSGGTNAQTTQLAKEFGVKIHGVAIGSYARKIVYEYINREDFWTNKEVFESAKKKAKELVDISLKYL